MPYLLFFLFTFCSLSCSSSFSEQRQGVFSPRTSEQGSLKRFLTTCERLARSGLRYQYGSNDPRNGGLDCSGTVQYTLSSVGYKNVPRQANTIYLWLERQRLLRKISRFESKEQTLASLRPGNLIFWKGTYNVKRHPNVTHVMTYMGYNAQRNKHYIFGGRSKDMRGIHGNGIDIFELKWPRKGSKGKIIAIGTLPAL